MRFDDRATQPARGPLDILKWKLTAPPRARDNFKTPTVENDGALVRSPAPSLTWIGHASFALRLGGQLILTDPVFSTRIGGAVARRAPLGVAPLALGPVDVVTVSHNHFDHMDLPTLKKIGPGALYVVPLGCARWLRPLGLENVVELDWWQSHTAGGVEITLVPARHWSMRMPWTRNQSLWGGFVYSSADGVAYHAGDTAHFDGFAEIGRRFAIDWAMLPIGAYEPRWFMQPQHMNPEEAGDAFLQLGAKQLVAMHWGTFILTDEPVGEPPARMLAFFDERKLDPASLWIPAVGEGLALRRR